ncbi:MAG: phage tail tape measure protein [Clostridia bacterium]|nr:phage tail tape measure protein [Clostridia bacterium]
MAAGAIKGITVEIGGDTTKLNKALSDVNKESKSLQQELRGINSLLKLDPGNTELLSQKQKVLAESVDNTKKKLEQLKSVEEQVNQQFANGEIGEKEFRDFQREIISTEEKLKSLETEMKEFGSVSAQQIAAAGEKMKDVGGKIEGAGKAFAPVSAAVADVGKAAVKVTADFDSAMSQVKALSGATGEDFDALREKAQEMGAKTAFSATEAAEGMQYMALAGWNTQQMLGGISGILNLAAAAQMDLGEASDIVTDALTAFGLKAEDSSHFADLLARTSSRANTTVHGLGEAFKYCAPVAGALGFTAEDTALAIGLMANAGVKGSQAGTSLRGIFSQLTSELKITNKAGEEFNVQTVNADGSMRSLRDILIDLRESFSHLSESEQAATAKSLFQQRSMTGALAIVNATDESFNALADSIDNCGGSAQEMADTQLDNLSGQVTLLKSALESAAISIGDVITPYVRKAVEIVQELVDKFNELPESTKKIIVVVGAVVAAIGPTLVVVGKLMQSVGSIMTMAPKIQGAISGLQGTFSAITGVLGGLSAPILAIVAAIGVLVAAFVTLWNTNDEFREKVIGIWEEVKAKFDEFCNNVVELLNSLGFQFSDITEVIKAVWEGFCNFFAPIFEAVFAQIADILKAAIDVICGILEIFIGVFTGDWSKAWDGVKTVFSAIINLISATFKNFVDLIGGLLGKLVDAIKTAFSKALDAAKTWVKNLGQKGKEAITSLIDNVISAGKSIPGKMLEIGKNIVQGVWNGIVNAKDWFTNKVKDFFGSIVTTAKEVLGIHSPSTVMEDKVGYQIPPGLGRGIIRNSKAALQPLRNLFDDMINMGDGVINDFPSGTVQMPTDYGAILAAMNNISNKLDNLKIYLNGRTLVGGIIRDVDDKLSEISRQKARGM